MNIGTSSENLNLSTIEVDAHPDGDRRASKRIPQNPD